LLPGEDDAHDDLRGRAYRSPRPRAKKRAPSTRPASLREPVPPLAVPPGAVEPLRALALALRQVVVVTEVLLGQELELVAGGAADGGLVVHEGVDEPLDAVAAGVPGPPVAPAAGVAAEVLPRDQEEGAARRLDDVLRRIFESAEEGR